MKDSGWVHAHATGSLDHAREAFAQIISEIGKDDDVEPTVAVAEHVNSILCREINEKKIVNTLVLRITPYVTTLERRGSAGK